MSSKYSYLVTVTPQLLVDYYKLQFWNTYISMRKLEFLESWKRWRGGYKKRNIAEDKGIFFWDRNTLPYNNATIVKLYNLVFVFSTRFIPVCSRWGPTGLTNLGNFTVCNSSAPFKCSLMFSYFSPFCCM